MIALQPLGHPTGGYRRLWTGPLTLWYCIWQWLQPRHTLEAVVADARRGGADGLSHNPDAPLSKSLHSKSTASFSDARQRFMGALLAPLQVSEQALAVQLMLGAAKPALYIGDRNFGVWRVVRAAAQSGGQALVRLTEVRARRLFGRKRLPGFLDLPRLWVPTAQDQVDPGLTSGGVEGRLLVVKTARRGHRPRVLYLFTTLTDREAYPPERLLEMHGWRWRVELNFRTVKTTLQMDQSEAKSAEMARKEF